MFAHYWATLKIPNNCKTLLDAGCGRGVLAPLVKTCFGLNPFMVGTDLYLSALKKAKELDLYDGLVMCDNVHMPFRRSFGIGVGIHTLEHLTKIEGVRFLRELERVSDTVIIVSPKGRVESTPRDAKDVHIIGLNPYNYHRSFWYPGDMKRLGYKVRGIPEGSLWMPGILKVLLCVLVNQFIAIKRCVS